MYIDCISFNYKKTITKNFENVKSLVLSKEFFSHTISFCESICQYDNELAFFLTKYFTIDGYIESCLVPLLLLDLFNKNTSIIKKYYSDDIFTEGLIKYLRKFYYYCLNQISTMNNSNQKICDINDQLVDIKFKQSFINQLHQLIITILKNIRQYQTIHEARGNY
ncbi:hypothetical protein ACAG39_08470 [Caldicellulosiruptoraceae bacterium PP1]